MTDEHVEGVLPRNDPRHMRATHERWMERRNRRQEDASYQDEWYGEQCGACAFWVPLSGQWGLDYGACSNPASPFDGLVRFEHDGCEFFMPAGEWATPEW